MKEIQESQAFVALAGVTDPKIPVGDDRYHDGSCQRSLLIEAFCFKLCVCSHKRGEFHMT